MQRELRFNESHYCLLLSRPALKLLTSLVHSSCHFTILPFSTMPPLPPHLATPLSVSIILFSSIALSRCFLSGTPPLRNPLYDLRRALSMCPPLLVLFQVTFPFPFRFRISCDGQWNLMCSLYLR